MKEIWVGYNVGCTLGLLLGQSAWQIDWPSNGSMWNCYSFQPVGRWMGYLFTDLGAEGCCHSLNAWFYLNVWATAFLWMCSYTHGCNHNHVTLQPQRQNTHQTDNSQKTPPSFPPRGLATDCQVVRAPWTYFLGLHGWAMGCPLWLLFGDKSIISLKELRAFVLSLQS